MERCPNCGSPGRQGARFCTTCGFRFLDDDDGAIAGDASAPAGEDESESIAAWPSAPAPQEPLPGGWGQDSEPAAMAVSTSPEPAADDAAIFWPEATSDSDPWPAPPPVATDAPGAAMLLREGESAMGSHGDDPETTANDEPTTGAIDRAQRLLDELRETIGSIERGSSFDLSGVISDLEVAVTPPGALPPDDVAELREALLAARERPRDVDTIVDLTKRVDSLLALVISYDRAVAAIERSLDVLRNEGETRVIGS